jgi:hypothetical protein
MVDLEAPHRLVTGTPRRHRPLRWWVAVTLVATGVVGAAASAAIGATPPARASTAPVTVPHAGSRTAQHRAATGSATRSAGTAATTSPTTTPTTSPATTPTTTATPTTVPATPAASPAEAPTTTQTAVDASLVAQVEASGIVPGAHWSWTVGDTAAQCHITPAPGQGTGCTSWSSGTEVTVFEGPVTLALVAHEIANAETEAYAVPALLSQVLTASGGSSWSATDAVASCLVAHFLGFQDHAAGSWQCPADLATVVATHIHDTVVTTRITATCGVASGTSSTLTFSAGTGTLAVTSSAAGSVPETAPSGGSVVVSGIGTFVATDTGGTVTLTGACTA